MRVENEEEYVRVVPTKSGNNGGNKIKLRIGIGGNRKREERQSAKVETQYF